jgi:hypothetical protein
VLALRIGCSALVAWSAAGCGTSDPPLVPPEHDAGADAAADAFDPADACAPPALGDLPCDVSAVLDICRNCHTMPPVRMAPFPFLTYEDTQAIYFPPMRRWQRMQQVIEPNDPVHMPPPTATDIPQLTDAQLDTLRAWFRACTPPQPEGQGCDKGETE